MNVNICQAFALADNRLVSDNSVYLPLLKYFQKWVQQHQFEYFLILIVKNKYTRSKNIISICSGDLIAGIFKN